MRRQQKFRNRSLDDAPSIKNFWNFVRQHGKATHHPTASYDDTHQLVFDPDCVRDQVYKTWKGFFHRQSTPNPSSSSFTDPGSSIPNKDELLEHLPHFPPSQHEAFVCRPFTRKTLEQYINKLKLGKSCGVDNIPAEAIKYGSPLLHEFLLHFYNKILLHGLIPVKLNIGKCLLVHKVCTLINSFFYV